MKYLTLLLVSCTAIDLLGQVNSLEKEVSIFTNGNSYVFEKIKVQPKDSSYRISNKDIPNARMGTLWITDASNSVESIISRTDTIESKVVTSITFENLLQNNVGREILAITSHNTLKGKIKEVYGSGYLALDPLGTENSMHWQFIKLSDIEGISFSEEPELEFRNNLNANQILSTKTERILEVNFSDSNQKEMYIEYLQKGMSWRPFYYLNIESKSEAKLLIKAEVINDSDEIKNSKINFVVGVPNFKYSGQLTDLVDFNNKLNPYSESQQHDRYLGASLEEVVIVGNNVNNEKFHDFHIYSKEDIDLPKNSRAHYNLAEQKIKYDHIYECDMQQFMDYSNSYNSNNRNPQTPNKVFHSLKFTNDSKNLLGEGPIIIVDKTKGNSTPLAQDKLDFTASGATTVVKITESPEIEINHIENVIERSDEPTKFWGREYYRAKVKGLITLENYKDEKLNLNFDILSMVKF